jgi:hypothetical protein
MATEAHGRQWRPPVERALAENALRERYEQRQRELRRGGTRTPEDRPGPLEFDALGFPIPQPIPGFVRRVRRLIGG